MRMEFARGLPNPRRQQFLSSMALGRMLSHHTHSHFDEQKSAEQAEPVHQVRKKLERVRGRARAGTQGWVI